MAGPNLGQFLMAGNDNILPIIHVSNIVSSKHNASAISLKSYLMLSVLCNAVGQIWGCGCNNQ